MSTSESRLTWSELFYNIAVVSSKRSEDPHTKVGACLVKDGHVIGIGYNGAPKKFAGHFRWDTSEKYDFVIHAEMNAIANACSIGVSCSGAEIYVTLSPCHDCIKLLVQHEIKKVYFTNRYRDFDLALQIATACSIKMIELTTDGERITGERKWN
jgi:dCMP deaminase